MSFPRYPDYKASGVEWLGDVPKHWEVKALKDVASCNDDVLSEDTEKDFEFNYVDISSVSLTDGIQSSELIAFANAPSRARRKVRTGDIIVSTVRTYLKAIARIGVNSKDFIVSTGFAVIRPKDLMNSSFTGYALLTDYFQSEVISRSTGVSYPAINASELIRINICIPPIAEQKAVANFLDCETAKIDGLIEAQRRLVELLKEKRQAVISHAVTKGLNPNAPMKPSGIEWLGEIPEHWTIRKLKHVSPQLTVGVVINPSTLVSDEGLPFIYGGDIREGVIDWQNSRRINQENSDKQSKTKLQSGDLLMVRVGAPGVTAVVPSECEGGNCASVMLIRRGNFSSDWFCYILNTRVVRFQVEVVQYGAAQEQFNISHAVNFVVPVPPVDEQHKIADFLKRLTNEINSLIAESENGILLLQERRTALISAAVTGKIDVRGLAGSEPGR